MGMCVQQGTDQLAQPFKISARRNVGCLTTYRRFQSDCMDVQAYLIHWRRSHYALTYVHDKNSNIQRRSSNVVYHYELLLKERIHSLWEQILTLREVPILKREANADPVVSL